MQNDPARYAVSLAEIDRRKETIGMFREETLELKTSLKKSKSVQLQKQQQQQQQQRPPAVRNASGSIKGKEREDSSQPSTDYDLERQEQLFADQDEQLDEVYHTVGTLRDQAMTMGDELDDQAM